MIVGTVIITLLAMFVAIVIWKMKSVTRLGFSRRTHFIFMGSYIALLVVILIVSEMLTYTQVTPDLKRASSIRQDFDIDRAIVAGQPIPKEELLIERQHEVKGTLTIKEADDNNSYYYIERSQDGGNQVIERIYRPSVINGEDFNGYDLSNYVEVNFPEWTDNEVTVPLQPKQKLVFISFHDSNIISQFTKQHIVEEYYNAYSVRWMIIHLIIPESVQLDIQLESGTYNEVTRD